MPRVSVIVPNYNHAPYLRRRLDSIYAQLYRDFEVVILDDGSQDGSLAIIEEYAERPNTRFIRAEENSGSVFRQWEKGIAHSCGELIWLAESDDAASAFFLATLVPLFDADRKIGLAYAQSWMIDPEGRVRGDARGWTADLSPTRWRRDFRNDGRGEIRDFLVHKNTIPNASAVLLRRAALAGAGGVIKEPMRLCGDWLQWVRILASWRIAYSAHRLNYWRQQTSNARLQVNGILEWTEGQAVVDEACQIVGLSELHRLQRQHELLARCAAWQRESLRRSENGGSSTAPFGGEIA